MKRSVLAVALVVVFIIAMASAAYASWMDSTYTPWSQASAMSGSTQGSVSPHREYSTTSRDCSVCHAVHNARSGAEVLLKDQITDACTYCHITTNEGVRQVYAALESNYTSDIRGNHSGFNQSTGGGVKGGCSGCHSVHSAKTVATGQYILRQQTNPTGGAGYVQPTIGTGSFDDTQETYWCSTCHPYYTQDYNKTSHVMTDIAGSHTYNNSAKSASVPASVAATKSQFCVDCHNAGTAANKVWADFPHYTPSAPRFLVDGVTSTANTMVANNDGPCLRCHQWQSTMGVSKSF